MMLTTAVADAATRVVIEQFLQGEEASFIVICDGKDVVALATSQDHKRLLDGDEGPNTGGMGAYSPAPVVTPSPACQGDARDHSAHHPRHGEGRHQLHRFSVCRFDDRRAGPAEARWNSIAGMGDPETQPILMRLKTDLLDLLLAATAGQLDTMELEWDRRPALGVVVAAAGYPMNPRKGDAINGLPKDSDDAMVFHAGTVEKDGVVLSAGGRVLCVTALADSVKQAQQRAYDVARGIHFDGMQYRRDIGYRAIKAMGRNE
jgi:phosphoribosylamine--glycine ligase